MMKAITNELSLRQNYLLGAPVSTVYFGGGTPSLLTPMQIEVILACIEKNFKLSGQFEITMEANPDDISLAYLQAIGKVGINRLSVGIQSFQDPVLQWMNRVHDRGQALNCIETCRSAGFDNISIDIIYGIPLTEYDLEEDLLTAVRLGPDHISAYNLTIEPGTVFGHRLKKGLLQEVTEDVAARNFQMTMEVLHDHGFQHYEISNFCLPGKESRHNLGYWNRQPFLGVGPSAHSFDGKNRHYNISSNSRYLKEIKSGTVPGTIEILTDEQRINEMIMLGLRTRQGVDLQIQCNSLCWDLEDQYPAYIEKLVRDGLAVIEKNKLILTNQGKLLADGIAADLFMDI